MTGLRTTLSCFDRIFSKASTDKYYLSVRLEPDGLFFSVYDPDLRKYIAFESVLLAGVPEIYHYLSNHEVLNSSFRNSLCIVPSRKYTLMPEALFIPQRAEEYFNFVHTIEPGEELRNTTLLADDVRLIYASNMAWFQIIKDHFKQAIVLPQVAAFIDYIVPRFRNTTLSAMFINLYDGYFDLLILDGGKLQFCNNFTYKTVEDLVYYTIFVIDQLKINVEKVELKLTGNISPRQEELKLFRKYVKKVNVFEPANDVAVSYALNGVNLSGYTDLFNPRLCEL